MRPISLLFVVATLLFAGCDAQSTETEVAQLEPPYQLAPQDGDDAVANALTLAWRRSDGAESYRVQIALSPAFTSPVQDELGIMDTSFDVIGLGVHTPYFWRVCAEGPEGPSEWSPTRSFVPAMEARIPDVVPQVFPDDRTFNMPDVITFQWEAVPHASSYDLQLGIDPNYIRKEVDMTAIFATKREISQLTIGYDYWWKVRARNPLGVSAWSESRWIIVAK